MSELSGQLSRLDGNRTDWVTPDKTPDPNPLPNISGYNILIRPVSPEGEIKVKGGGAIILPPSVTEDIKFLNNVGQVKAMGPSCYHDPNVTPKDGNWFPYGRYKKPWCKVGDYVVWAKHQGVKLMIKGVTFVLLQDELVLMTLDKPQDISPLFNLYNN